MGAKTRNTSTVMQGARGRGGSQHVAARPPPPIRPPPPPTLGSRSAEKTREMRKQLLDVFPDNAKQIESVLQQNQCIHSIDELCLKVFEVV